VGGSIIPQAIGSHLQAGATQRKSDSGKTPDHRSLLSRAAAKDAAYDASVIAFREEVLEGALLKAEEVKEWINRQERSDGPATHWIRDVPVPSNHKITWLEKERRFGISPELEFPSMARAFDFGITGAGTQLKTLAYVVAGEQWVRYVPTAHGGVLDRLREITERLACRYEWDQASGTLFILTGAIPVIEPLSSQIDVAHDRFRRRVIELRVDPALSPEQVAAHYRRLRQKIMPRRRVRELSEKHLRLAALEVERPADESWSTRMSSWNQSYPRWKYHHQSNFRRDVLKARSEYSPQVLRSRVY